MTGVPNNYARYSDKEYDEWLKQTQLVKLSSEEQASLEAEVRKQPGWSEEKNKELYLKARDEVMQRKRMELFLKAENKMLEEPPVIPIYYYVSTAMVRPYVSGYYQNLQDHHPLKGIRVDAEKRAAMLSTGTR